MINFRFVIIILMIGNLLGDYSYALAQPEDVTYDDVTEANSLFKNEKYEKALIIYQKVIDDQPSNKYVLEQIRKSEEELLYTKITDGSNVDDDCREYINKYGNEGRYIVNVKNILSKNLLSQAHDCFNKKEIDSLEFIYYEYLTLLGYGESKEMKQRLYSLCYEEAEKQLKNKEWVKAKSSFGRSLKYYNTNKEFIAAQEGIAQASKKIK